MALWISTDLQLDSIVPSDVEFCVSQLRCKAQWDESMPEQTSEVRTMLEAMPLQRHHAFFTLDRQSNNEYTLACPKVS